VGLMDYTESLLGSFSIILGIVFRGMFPINQIK